MTTEPIKGLGVALTDVVIFPQSVQRIRLPDGMTVLSDQLVAVYSKNHQLSSTGVLCDIVDTFDQSDGRFAVVEGLTRVNIVKRQKKYVYYTPYDVIAHKTKDLLALSKRLYDGFRQHHTLMTADNMSMDTLLEIVDHQQPDEMADMIASYMTLSYDEKVTIIESIDVYHRVEQVAHALNQWIIDQKIDQELDMVIQDGIASERKEMMLKAKLRAIQAELNTHSQFHLVGDYESKLSGITLANDHRQLIASDIQRLDQYPDDSTEFALLRAYLDTFFSIPWNKRKSSKIDIARVRRDLDADHYGLESVKTRILEHLAVRKISKKRVGTIICLAGPPGVGKTSIIQSVAQALRRPFIRLALGGVRDEAELRGHRRAYVGAMPGKIINGLIKAGCINPVICLDEVDKLAGGFKGDPSAALLEILDIEQNRSFVDHYIQCPVDLSECMFICTANDVSAIPEPLLNRMEVITISGYTVQEKVSVGSQYILPHMINDLGLNNLKFAISESLWGTIVNLYTSDVGLRELRQVIDKLCRKVALMLVDNVPIPEQWDEPFVVSILGEGEPKPRFSVEPRVGRSVGLMLRSMVGHCCPIETQIYQGNPGFTATGNIDPKINESIQIVFGLLKTRFKDYAIDANLLFDYHFHIHFQNTNLFKTGSGWDLGIFVSIMSMLLNIPLPGTLTFSGQLSLSGKILPVGGVSQKLLAASHLGIRYLVVSSMESGCPAPETYSTQLITLNTIDDVISLLVKWYL